MTMTLTDILHDVSIEPPVAPESMPVTLRPQRFGVDLVGWAAEHVDHIEALLHLHGAVRLRGFKVNGSAHLERLIGAMYRRELIEYTNRSTPRSQVRGRIYTSTEYPADAEIPMHNENAYTSSWPSRLFFLCVRPSVSGGQTPVADSRRVLQRLSPSLIERFERCGVRYVRNYGVLDLPWQDVFQTDSHEEVEAFCHQRGIAWTWKSDGGLRTSETCQATTVHPVTGEKVWFNQAHLFHVSSLVAELRDALAAGLALDDLPRNACLGDGSPIDEGDLADIRAAFAAESVAEPWQAGDVLLLDNVLAAHGRRPFTGERSVLVGMV